MYENHEEQTGGPGTPPPGEFSAGPKGKLAEHKSALAAVFLSLMPGLGQVYVGYYQRGFTNMLVVATVVTLLSSGALQDLEPLFGVFLAFFWIYNMIDAARCANAVNSGQGAGIQSELPQLPAAVGGGSVFAGALLVVLGCLILGRTVFGISLEWLVEWWPVILIIFGVRLIVTGRRQPPPGR